MADNEAQGIPVYEYPWTKDYSFMRAMTCRNHPTARYLTKNPYDRSIFTLNFSEGMFTECDCPFEDLIVLTPPPKDN